MVQNADKEQPKEIPSTTVEVLVKPLEMLIQGKNSKAYHSLLSIFQVLAAANLLTFAHKISLLELSLKLLDSSDDMIPIKVVQILLIMITRNDVVKEPLANKVS